MLPMFDITLSIDDVLCQNFFSPSIKNESSSDMQIHQMHLVSSESLGYLDLGGWFWHQRTCKFGLVGD